LIANADDALLNGHPDTAVSLLTQAIGDITPPTVTTTLPPSSANGWWSQTPTVTLTADDGGGSGIATLQYKLDDADWTDYVAHFQVTGEGPHTLLVRATDRAGNETDNDAVSIGIDTIAPTTTVTPDRGPDYNGWYNAPVTFSPSGDDGGGSGIASCDAPVAYSGPDTATAASVVLTCTDLAGNSSSGSSGSFQYDATAPVLTVPSDIVQEATGPSGAAVSFTATAVDGVDGPVATSCSSASGSTFPLGHTQVQCTAVDQAGNLGTASFDVLVPDTTAPQVDPPANVVAEATGPGGAVATYGAATATDLVDGPLPVACSPASGTTFPLGDTHVVCTATDSTGNVGSSSFDVLVVDTTAPVVTPHPDVAVDATSPHGVAVAFVVSATDIVDGGLTATCSPASGTVFVIGHTTVVCSVTDAHGNAGSTSFDVYVRGALDQLQGLESLVRSFHLNRFVEWEYRIMLQSIERSLIGRRPHTAVACFQLRVFALQAKIGGGRRLTKTQSSQLVAAANRISAVLGC
jgi:hypothetical protein